VHRLDKETTGVIVVAKSDKAHRALADQFSSRTLKKEYLALVVGVPQLLSGTIDRAISRHPIHRHRMTVGEGGKPSRTAWERIETFGDIAVSYVVGPIADAGSPPGCRLLVKLIVKHPRGLYGRIMRAVLPWGDLIMMRRQLLNLKRFAEQTEQGRTD